MYFREGGQWSVVKENTFTFFGTPPSEYFGWEHETVTKDNTNYLVFPNDLAALITLIFS